jgi:Transglycosylase SLT domain
MWMRLSFMKSRFAVKALQISLMSVGLTTIAHADCLDAAAAYYHVNGGVVHAIAQVESGMQPHRVNINRNGSVDIGLMQVNSSWLPVLARYGIGKRDLYDGCTNAYVGTWILARNIRQLGPTWDAVGAYNATSPMKRRAYARRVYNVVTGASDSRSTTLPLYLPLHHAFARAGAELPMQSRGRGLKTCYDGVGEKKLIARRKKGKEHLMSMQTTHTHMVRDQRPEGRGIPLIAYENRR